MLDLSLKQIKNMIIFTAFGAGWNFSTSLKGFENKDYDWFIVNMVCWIVCLICAYYWSDLLEEGA